MEIVLLAARLVLSVVLSVAGAAKVADLAGSRRSVVDFGLPDWAAAPIGYSLPFVELLVALALLPRSTAWLSAVTATGLFVVFAAAIAVNLVRGRAPDCNCFGQLHSKPVSWSLFARDLMLAAGGVLIATKGKTSPGLSAFNWLDDLKAGEIAGLALSTIAVGLLAFGIVFLRRVMSQQSSLLARIEAMKKVIDEDYAESPVERADATGPVQGLPVGAPAPQFSLVSINGKQQSLSDFLTYRKQVLLLFVSPNCSPCKSVLESVRTWERDYRKHLIIALLTKGDVKENQDRLAAYGASHLLLQGESAIADEYEAKWTPAAVLIGGNGKIASQVVYGFEPIRALVARSASIPVPIGRANAGANGNGRKPRITVATPQAYINLGEPAPSFSLPDMRGKMVRTEDLLGRDTLLLFWDPKCPFCQKMSENIWKWERNPPGGAPRLVFIASGDAQDVKAHSERFQSRFLYDSESEVAFLFGTNLTPSAVLIDSEGRIASAPEAGEVNVLSLAGVRKPAALAAFAV